MNMKSRGGIVAALVTVSLSLGGAPALAEDANTSFGPGEVSNLSVLDGNSKYSPVVEDEQISPFDEMAMARDPRVAELEEGLAIIDEIPESVLLQGDEALAKWLAERSGSATSGPLHASVLGCAGAIASLIGGNMVGVAKLAKIKRYIKTLGGVKKTAELIWKAGFSWKNIKRAGGALGALGAEILGIRDVQQECFK